MAHLSRRWRRIGAIVIVLMGALLLLTAPQRVAGVMTTITGLALDAVGISHR